MKLSIRAAIFAAVFGLAGLTPAAGAVREDVWGKMPDGRPIHRFTFTNPSGASVSVMELGAAITAIVVPDRAGKLADVALGFDSALDYATNNSPQFGLVIGRYANRIVGGTFKLGGTEYRLATQRSAMAIAPGARIAIPPDAIGIGELGGVVSVWAATLFAAPLGAHEADEVGDLGPVDWVEPAMFGTYRHGAILNHAGPERKGKIAVAAPLGGHRGRSESGVEGYKKRERRKAPPSMSVDQLRDDR
jgi:hypothetical protein